MQTKFFIRGKFTKVDRSALDSKVFTAGSNNCLHSLFSQCTIALNGVNIKQSGDLYDYRAYLETLVTCGSGAALSHLTNSYWYKDDGNMLPCDPTKSAKATTNAAFVARWNRQKQRKEIEMYGRMHSDICNVSEFILPGVGLQTKFTKARPIFYLINTDADSRTIFKFRETKLYL